MALYEKIKAQGDFDGDRAASVLAHMINLGATVITIRTGKSGILEFESDAKLPEDQLAHLELTEKATAVEAEAIKP